MKELYEKFCVQQEKTLKEAREMKARRMELEERQAQRKKERETHIYIKKFVLVVNKCLQHH